MVYSIFTDDDKTKIREILISSFSEPLPQVIKNGFYVNCMYQFDLKRNSGLRIN